MFSRVEWLIAGRYLRARRQEGFISVIAVISLVGIALGVATLIIVMAVMNGFRVDLLARIIGINGHLTVYADLPIKDYDTLSADLVTIDGVTAVVPQIQSQTVVQLGNTLQGALVQRLQVDSYLVGRIPVFLRCSVHDIDKSGSPVESAQKQDILTSAFIA